MIKDQIFFVGQKALIKNKNNEILVLYDEIIGLDLPGGKVQTGEVDVISSLKREVKEETDLLINVKNPFYTWVFNYPVQKEGLDKRTGGNLYLVGYDCEFVSGEITLSNEHTGFEWVSKNNYNKLHNKGGHYKIVDYYFSEYLSKHL